MIIIVVSNHFERSLYACVYGYARLHFKDETRKIFSIVPLPFLPIVGLLAGLALLWLLLKKRSKKVEVGVENFLTKRNEGVLISDEEKPGLIASNKENLAKNIGIAIDRAVARQGVTPNHVMFLLGSEDMDVFTNEVMEIIGDKYVWLFVEQGIQRKYKSRLEKIGKTVIFNQKYLRAFGNEELTLGMIARYLSLVSRDGDTNLDHLYHAIPDFSTISYAFPIDDHSSLTSALKHQKHLCANRGEPILHITNHKEFMEDLPHPAKYDVKADTESFLISFMEAV